MTLNCPFQKTELELGFITAAGKLEAYQKKNGKDSVINAFESWNLEAAPARLNELVAAHHGITLELLINSPNYEKLKAEYFEHRAADVLQKLQKEFELSLREAWAVIAVSSLGQV